MENLTRLSLLTDANSVAAGQPVKCNVTPFLLGTTVVGEVNLEGFTGTVVIQTSEDGATWSDAASIDGSTSDKTAKVDIKLAQYVRGNVTARSAGSVSASLLA